MFGDIMFYVMRAILHMGLFGFEFSKNNRFSDLIVILLINCLKNFNFTFYLN